MFKTNFMKKCIKKECILPIYLICKIQKHLAKAKVKPFQDCHFFLIHYEKVMRGKGLLRFPYYNIQR